MKCPILLLLLAVCGCARADCLWEPFEDEATGLMGYEDGLARTAVPARFAIASNFDAHGLAGVVEAQGDREHSAGYLNCRGEVLYVLPSDNGPDYFQDGLVRILRQGRIGYADRSGAVVIAPQYEWAEPFCSGVAKAGSHCSFADEGEHRAVHCRRQHYIDRSGRSVPKPVEAGQCAGASVPEAPQPESGRMSGMTDAHNRLRAALGVGLPPLRWDPQIAAHAAQWAQVQARNCVGMGHRPGNPYGENIAGGSDTSDAEDAFALWMQEQADFDPRRKVCRRGLQCGHYTQIVWRDTTRLGCGMAACDCSDPARCWGPASSIWVCNYDPPGNYDGELPY